MSVLRQLVKEFWLPMLISIGWTIFNFKDNAPIQLQAKDVINVFGPTFFLISWVLAQFFRVRNQQHVRSGLSTIEQRISSLDEQVAERVRVEKEMLLASAARRLHEGAPKFQSVQNDRLPDRFFIDSDKLQRPYFSWIINAGRTVYDVELAIYGANLQMIQGTNRSDYDLNIPVWSTGQLFRIVWTYDNNDPIDQSTLAISYTDTFGVSAVCKFSVERTTLVDSDGLPMLQMVELLESEKSHVHSGKQNLGYDYMARDARRTFESELEKVAAIASKAKNSFENNFRDNG